MRELPGLYWDEARHRYFPVASRPKPAPSWTVGSAPEVPHKLNPPLWNLLPKRDQFSALRLTERTYSALQRDRQRHFFTATQIASTTSRRSVHVPLVFSAHITSLKISDTEINPHGGIFLGDLHGWCYAGDCEDSIVAQAYLHSEISSIQQSIDLIIYTSFGPFPMLLLQKPSTQTTVILAPPHLEDVRTSRLQGQSLTLGMRRRALHIPDLERIRITKVLDTGSDVFALHREDHALWAGARDGTVRLFDLRSGQRQEALGGRYHNKHVSVTHIQRVRDHQLLISAIDGSLELFDIRFSCRCTSAVPLRTLKGHRNTYTHNLGIATDRSQDFLFAAGQDQRIRGWSLRTGEAIESLVIHSHEQNPFSNPFQHPIYGLEVTSETPAGTLWVASGSKLERFELGSRSRLD